MLTADVALGLENNSYVMVCTERAEVEISKRPGDAIHKIFLDPTGNHLLACLDGGETYYLHASSPRPKRLIKWSGVVEAVAFDAQRCNEVGRDELDPYRTCWQRERREG